MRLKVYSKLIKVTTKVVLLAKSELSHSDIPDLRSYVYNPERKINWFNCESANELAIEEIE